MYEYLKICIYKVYTCCKMLITSMNMYVHCLYMFKQCIYMYIPIQNALNLYIHTSIQCIDTHIHVFTRKTEKP